MNIVSLKSIYSRILIVFVDSAVCVCNFSVIYMKINILLYYHYRLDYEYKNTITWSNFPEIHITQRKVI